MRINKFLALSGVASRRKSEELVKSGVVKVNGEVLTSLGYNVKINDIVTVNGKKVQTATNFVYYKLNKPKGVVSTSQDDVGRRTVLDLMRGVKTRVFSVGRLDYDTEGLLIMTNDGELTNILTHPKHEVEKTYIATILGSITEDELKMLSKGVDIGDGIITRPCLAMLLDSKDGKSRIELTIHEGKNRQIRRMFEAIGKEVVFLTRTRIGEIRLGGLSRGEYKKLTNKEINFLKSLKK